jgi:hypothetical protein
MARRDHAPPPLGYSRCSHSAEKRYVAGLGGDGWPLEIYRKVLMPLGLAFAMRCEGAGIGIIRGRANTDQ